MPGAVLHHAVLPHRGGAVRVARLLIEAQKMAGHEARLSFEVPENDPEPIAAATQAAFPLCGPTPPGDIGRSLAQLPQDAILHLHSSTDWPALLAGLLPQAAGRTVLVTLHDATPLTGGCAYPLDCPHFPTCADPCPRLFRDAQARQMEIAARLRRLGQAAAVAIISPSRWLAGLARQVWPGIPAHIIPNGVPWPELAAVPSRAKARQTLGLEPGARVALFAAHGGARAAYKSGPSWPDYWRRLREALPQAVGFAVGGDEAGNRDGLTIWPYVNREKLRLLMRAADALLYPTLADNHPLVLLEAAALELPVASFAVGGVPEIVLNGETGLLTPAGDADAFQRAALDLLGDPARSRRLGRAARAHGAKRFTAARMAADYAERADKTPAPQTPADK
ncbi:MAG: glycosyltransferase [Humidesulfovibrio sp.]|nr:glycosyltransferase [Humidesulfovibrio sp.]